MNQVEAGDVTSGVNPRCRDVLPRILTCPGAGAVLCNPSFTTSAVGNLHHCHTIFSDASSTAANERVSGSWFAYYRYPPPPLTRITYSCSYIPFFFKKITVKLLYFTYTNRSKKELTASARHLVRRTSGTTEVLALCHSIHNEISASGA